MDRTSFARCARAALVAGLASLSLAAFAQDTPKKPPRRLPPLGSQTSDIPAGVDTGSPATSNSMPLGTPIPPANAADREDQNKRSAAARAAARPGPALRPAPDTVPAGPAVLGVDTSRSDPTASVPRPPPTQRTASRKKTALARADCASGTTGKTGAPVALPHSGFVGSSASPATASAVERGPGTSPSPCP